MSESLDREAAIVRASSPTTPPRYYLWKRDEKVLKLLFSSYPSLKSEQLAPVKPVSLKARDGVTLHGYLTLPLGRQPENLPLVALIHGGPHVRDVLDFDPEVQAFANRGIAVLQINYRGSSGFGSEFRKMGDRNWGLSMQDDITDAVKWATESGIADPKRVGIYGASYGGYAAMMGLVKTPELFRCGAAYAGVFDLFMFLDNADQYVGGRQLWEEQLGNADENKERFKATSPARNAKQIQVPVLLAHGEHDPTADVDQTKRMARALKKAKKDYEVMIFKDEIHGFKEESNRLEFYTRLLDFFETHLTGGESEWVE